MICTSPTTGCGPVAVTNSHHFGAAAYHLRPVAEAGLVGLALGNSPAEFGEYIRQDYAKWQKVVTAANIRSD